MFRLSDLILPCQRLCFNVIVRKLGIRGEHGEFIVDNVLNKVSVVNVRSVAVRSRRCRADDFGFVIEICFHKINIHIGENISVFVQSLFGQREEIVGIHSVFRIRRHLGGKRVRIVSAVFGQICRRLKIGCGAAAVCGSAEFHLIRNQIKDSRAARIGYQTGNGNRHSLIFHLADAVSVGAEHSEFRYAVKNLRRYLLRNM